MPEMSTEDLVWVRLGNQTTQKHVFQLMLNNTNSTNSTQLLLCNSSLDLEPGAFTASPKTLLPIGPLCTSSPSPWPVVDSSPLEWLNQHDPSSVTYVAFGSLTLLNKDQLEELALGLEMTNRPFLWATTTRDCSFPKGWAERTAGRGKVVRWTNQREVLGHPSIGCFLSHCGWNSTIEGVSNGVPFLCCPQFADQFLNKGYICDVWRVGVELGKVEVDGRVVVTRYEIKDKADKVYGDEEYRKRALEMKALVRDSVGDGGISHENFKYFVDWIKGL